jgi:hypothetical protein
MGLWEKTKYPVACCGDEWQGGGAFSLEDGGSPKRTAFTKKGNQPQRRAFVPEVLFLLRDHVQPVGAGLRARPVVHHNQDRPSWRPLRRKATSLRVELLDRSLEIEPLKGPLLRSILWSENVPKPWFLSLSLIGDFRPQGGFEMVHG